MPHLNSPSATINFTNKILRSLSPEAIRRLRLRPVRLELSQQIEFPGQPIGQLIFPESGAASMTTTFRDGSQVEVGLYGYEAVIGLSALMGAKHSLNRVYVQIAGHGFASYLQDARKEFVRGEQFQRLTMAYSQTQFLQAAQSAGCHAKHDVEQRLASWLLTCADRCQSETIPISQEFLATMLGVRRMSAVAAIAQLKSMGLIDHHRGLINIVDRHDLANQCCECYQVLHEYLNNAAEFDHGFVE